MSTVVRHPLRPRRPLPPDAFDEGAPTPARPACAGGATPATTGERALTSARTARGGRTRDNGPMDDTTVDPAPAAQGGPSPALHLERQGVRRYVARNARGAEVLVGDGPGRFSPGDLLKIALAGCNAMSSDRRFLGTLGEDFAQDIGVSGTFDEENDRYTSFQVELVQDLSALDDEQRERLERRVKGAVERNCTVGHTLSIITPSELILTSEPVDAPTATQAEAAQTPATQATDAETTAHGDGA